MKKYQKLLIVLNLYRLILGYFIFKHNKFKDKLKMDLDAWKRRQNINNSNFISFCYFIMITPEFRNVVLNRLHRNPIKYLLFKMMFKPMESLYINVSPEKIGGGLYFQHGFATIVCCKEIGVNCSINQQVTIGFNGNESATIKDNVTICAGAIVIGNVTLNNNCVIGAGSVVTKDVEENAVVAGVPARIIKYK